MDNATATIPALLAVDPIGLGGVRIRSSAGPVRDAWMEGLKQLFPSDASFRKLPPNIADARLLGGIDLAATLQAGRPVAQQGLLAACDGGVIVVPMAERLSATVAAHVAAALDQSEIAIERDGLSHRVPARIAVIAFDEGLDEEAAPPALCERLAFAIDLDPSDGGDSDGDALWTRDEIAAARLFLEEVHIGDDAIDALCKTAMALGVVSLRAPIFASRAARAAAALDHARAVTQDHVELAARLVLAPRATVIPVPQEDTPQEDDTPQETTTMQDKPLDDVVLDAALAAIPPDLLAQLQSGVTRRAKTSGKQGSSKIGPRRGRPVGVRRGEWHPGLRLNVLETLRAAAPWQRLRRGPSSSYETKRIVVRKDDFRITRFKERSETATIFVVDASGSSALQRLAEVKGAVELLLADCYIRRDQVALIAFRGTTAELLLPPTRSLTRAKRSLAALPGGGGTPLAAAIVLATALAISVRGKGQTPTIVLMTDGSANVSRDGKGGRALAQSEARDAARVVRQAGLAAILVDTSPRAQRAAQELAGEMAARYVALPYADATRLSRTVQTALTG